MACKVFLGFVPSNIDRTKDFLKFLKATNILNTSYDLEHYKLLHPYHLSDKDAKVCSVFGD